MRVSLALPLLSLGMLSLSCAYWTDDGQAPNTSASAASKASETRDPPTTAVKAASLHEKARTGPAATLRLAGSSTIGATLAPELLKAYVAHLGGRDVTVKDDDKAQKRVTVTGTVEDKAFVAQVEYPGSVAAFECLLAATCDIGMSSRPIAQDELARFKTPPTEHVLAMDGIAVIVHRANRVQTLSVEQIARTFRGEITSWSALGGAALPITVYGRDKLSGTYESMNQLALGGRGITAPNTQFLDDNDAVSDAVAKNERGIGFVGLPYVKQTRAVAVRDGDAQPQVPSAFSVQTEDYAFSRRLFLYTTDRLSTMGGDFVDFALGDDGQKVVAQVGFVAQQVSAQQGTVAVANAPPGYVKLTTGARRLSFDFRFRPATADLDGKARRDLGRLAAYLTANKNKVILLGFADNQGEEAKNVELSRLRSQAVSMELGKLGVAAEAVDGVGSALPVAPNTTPEGRLRNRRVEVWVK